MWPGGGGGRGLGAGPAWEGVTRAASAAGRRVPGPRGPAREGAGRAPGGPAAGRQVCFRPASARSGWNESFRWGCPAGAAAPSLPEPAPSRARPRPGRGPDQAERWSRWRERPESPGPGSQQGPLHPPARRRIPCVSSSTLTEGFGNASSVSLQIKAPLQPGETEAQIGCTKAAL